MWLIRENASTVQAASRQVSVSLRKCASRQKMQFS